MLILADISHYSQTFRTIVPLFWGQHASIMMYISALNARMTPQTLVFIINTGNCHVFIHIYLETSSVWTLSVIIERVAEPFDWRLLDPLRFSSCSLHLQIWFLIKIEGEAARQACDQLLHLDKTTMDGSDSQTSWLCGFIYSIVSREESTIVIWNTCSTRVQVQATTPSFNVTNLEYWIVSCL